MIQGLNTKKLSLIRKAYGDESQVMQTMEEAAELIQALCEVARYKSEKCVMKLLSEVADMFNVLEHIIDIYCFDKATIVEIANEKANLQITKLVADNNDVGAKDKITTKGLNIKKLSLIRKAYGDESQVVQTMKEAAELIQVLNKAMRYKGETEIMAVQSKIASMFNVLEHIIAIYCFDKTTIAEIANEKASRQIKRLITDRRIEDMIS